MEKENHSLPKSSEVREKLRNEMVNIHKVIISMFLCVQGESFLNVYATVATAGQ